MNKLEIGTYYSPDEATEDEIVNVNMNLIRKQAHLYKDNMLEYDDAWVIAAEAFVRALRKYNPNYCNNNATFVTFCCNTMKHALIDEKRRISSRLKNSDNEIVKTYSLDAKPEDYNHEGQEESNQNYLFGMASTELPLQEKGFQRMEQNELIKDALSHLTKEEAIIVDMIYFKECTQVEVAKKLNMTQPNVSIKLDVIQKKLRRIIVHMMSGTSGIME